MAITAEELRILVRAETKQAQREFRDFTKSTSSSTKELKKFATQLIGGLGVGYAIKKVVGFMNDSLDAYYKQTGEVNKLAEAMTSLKANIGESIVKAGFNDWLARTITQLAEGVRAVNNLKAARAGLTLDEKAPASAQIAEVEAHLARVTAAIATAKGNLAWAGSVMGNKGQAATAQAELSNLEKQKEYWELELAYQGKILSETLKREKATADAAAREAENQKLLQEEYKRTKEYAIEALEALITRFEKWTDQGPRTIASLRNMRAELEALYLAGSTQAEFSPLGMLPQTFPIPNIDPFGALEGRGAGNLSPEDFGVPALTESFDELANTIGIAGASLYGFQIIMAATAFEADNFKQQLWDAVGDEAFRAGLDTMASTFAALGEAMVVGGNGADLLFGSLQSITSQLSNIFLSAAACAFLKGPMYFEIGLGLLALALGTAFLGGIFGGAKQKYGSSGGGSSLPSPSSVSTVAYGGETVIINYNGDVFTADERAATTLATVRAAGGRR